MPGRFDFNPSEVSTGIEVLPKDRYVVTIREPKPYFNAASDTSKKDREGIQFPLVVTEGEYENKLMLFRPDFNLDFGPGQAKQLAMAAYGYTRKQEKEFNKDQAEKDWSLNTDPSNASLGDGWTDCKGRTVIANVDITIAKDGSGNEFQKFVSFEPYTGE